MSTNPTSPSTLRGLELSLKKSPVMSLKKFTDRRSLGDISNGGLPKAGESPSKSVGTLFFSPDSQLRGDSVTSPLAFSLATDVSRTNTAVVAGHDALAKFQEPALRLKEFKRDRDYEELKATSDRFPGKTIVTLETVINNSESSKSNETKPLSNVNNLDLVKELDVVQLTVVPDDGSSLARSEGNSLVTAPFNTDKLRADMFSQDNAKTCQSELESLLAAPRDARSRRNNVMARILAVKNEDFDTIQQSDSSQCQAINDNITRMMQKTHSEAAGANRGVQNLQKDFSQMRESLQRNNINAAEHRRTLAKSQEEFVGKKTDDLRDTLLKRMDQLEKSNQSNSKRYSVKGQEDRIEKLQAKTYALEKKLAQLSGPRPLGKVSVTQQSKRTVKSTDDYLVLVSDDNKAKARYTRGKNSRTCLLK